MKSKPIWNPADILIVLSENCSIAFVNSEDERINIISSIEHPWNDIHNVGKSQIGDINILLIHLVSFYSLQLHLQSGPNSPSSSPTSVIEHHFRRNSYASSLMIYDLMIYDLTILFFQVSWSWEKTTVKLPRYLKTSVFRFRISPILQPKYWWKWNYSKK